MKVLRYVLLAFALLAALAGTVASLLWTDLPASVVEDAFRSRYRGTLRLRMRALDALGPPRGRVDRLELLAPDGTRLFEAREGTVWWGGPWWVRRLSFRHARARVVLGPDLVPRGWVEALTPKGPSGSGPSTIPPITVRAGLALDIELPAVRGLLPGVSIAFPEGKVEFTSEGEGAFGGEWRGVRMRAAGRDITLPLVRLHGQGPWEGWLLRGRVEALGGTVRFSGHGRRRRVDAYSVRAVRLTLPPPVVGVVDLDVTGPSPVRWNVRGTASGVRFALAGVDARYRADVSWHGARASFAMDGIQGTYDATVPWHGTELAVTGRVRLDRGERSVLVDGTTSVPPLGPLHFQGSASLMDRRFVGLVGGRGYAFTVDYRLVSGRLRGSGEVSDFVLGGVVVKRARFSFDGTALEDGLDLGGEVTHARLLARRRWIDYSGTVSVKGDAISFSGQAGICAGVLRTRGSLDPFRATFYGTVSVGSCLGRPFSGRARVRGSVGPSRLSVTFRSRRLSVAGAVVRDVKGEFVLKGTNWSSHGRGTGVIWRARGGPHGVEAYLNATEVVVPMDTLSVTVSSDLHASFGGPPSPRTLKALSGVMTITDVKGVKGPGAILSHGDGLVRFDSVDGTISFFGTWAPRSRSLPRLQVSGTWREGEGVLTVSFGRFPVHAVVDLGGMKAWAMGTYTAWLKASGGSVTIRRQEVRLEGLLLHVPSGRGRVIVVRNHGPVVLGNQGRGWSVDGELVASGHRLGITGALTPITSISMKGTVTALLLMELMGLGSEVEHVSGRSEVDLLVTSLSPLRVRGRLEPRFSLVYRGQKLSITSGHVVVGPGGILLRNVRVGGVGSLLLNGTVAAGGASVGVHGAVNLGVLARMWPSLLARAEGRLTVDGTATWDGSSVPSFDGALSMGKAELVLRRFGHPITIARLRATVHGCRVEITEGRGTFLDGLMSVHGTVDLCSPLTPDFRLSLVLRDFHYEKPGVFYADANAHLSLRGRVPDARLTGHIDLIDGKYYQKFDVIRRILTVRRVHEEAEPFWKRYPQFGATQLDIEVSNSGRLMVDNNIGSLDLAGSLHLGGTLSDPVLTGRILVTGGTFSIPFLKGTYSVEEGSVDLREGRPPVLKLVGETQVEHYTGETFIIRLMLEGPLDAIAFVLRSEPPLEQGQILLLLASGRTVEDFRQSTRPDPQAGTSANTTAFNPIEVYDAPIKQVTGDFLSDLVSNPIKSVTRLDLLRLELGVDSIQIRVAKRLGRHVVLRGESEFGLMGRRRQEASLEVRLHDRVVVDSKVRRYVPDQESYEYEERLQGMVEIKYLLDLKGGLADMLGL